VWRIEYGVIAGLNFARVLAASNAVWMRLIGSC